MFAQVIQGYVKDAARFTAVEQQWMKDLQPGAIGWLGSTGGLTQDGECIMVVRFASAEEAKANGDRPEQDAWWRQIAPLFDGEPTFMDCTDVEIWGSGAFDDAGFVQVIQGRSDDMQRLAEIDSSFIEGSMATLRPDLLGGLTARSGDRFTQVAYFTSEAEAREGERKELPAEQAEAMREWEKLVTDLRYLDLSEPWLRS